MMVSKRELEIISKHVYDVNISVGINDICSIDMIRNVIEDAVEKGRILFSIVGDEIEYILLFRMLSYKLQCHIPFIHIVDGSYCFVEYFYCKRNYDEVYNRFFGRFNPTEFIFQRGMRGDNRFHTVSIERFKRLFKKV